MTRYTTPTLPLEVDADLSGNDVFVTLSQNGTVVTKQIQDYTVDEDGVTSISVPLTQEETGKFSAVAKCKCKLTLSQKRVIAELPTYSLCRCLTTFLMR